MTLLTDYAENINSQFGEDGIIRECLTRMGLLNRPSTALEVGASDGRECSNTLALRDLWGWHRFLVEADPTLHGRQEPHERDVSLLRSITAEGSNSLDSLLLKEPAGGAYPAFLSLDIDGDDYRVLERLKMRPELICTEFNQTIPLHLDVTSPQLGTSLKAVMRLMRSKDYCFLGATHCNAFFVTLANLQFFGDIEKDPALYFNNESLTYLVTSLYGGAVAFGPQIFGVERRFAGELDIVDGNGEVQTVRLTSRSVRSNW